jgi:hypothetical protein
MSSRKSYQLQQDTAMQITHEDILRAVCGPMLDLKKIGATSYSVFINSEHSTPVEKCLNTAQILQIALRTEFYEP